MTSHVFRSCVFVLVMVMDKWMLAGEVLGML